MLRYVAFRFVRMATVVFAVTLFTFFLVNLLPGSPINAILGPAAGDAHARAQLTQQLGLNHPIYQRYFVWLGHAIQGNLGQSYISGQTVLSAIAEHVPFTIELLIMAEVMSLILAIPLALWCSLRPGKFFDAMMSRISLGLLALPAFVLAELLIYIFSIKLHVFPASGETTWFYFGNSQTPAVIATPQSIVLPAIVLALGQLAIFFRVLRGDLLGTLRSQYIVMARSKGLTTRRILFRHALRPSSFSLLTLVGLSIGGLIAGAVVVEVIFGLPGIGTLLVTSIEKRDYLMIQGLVVLVATGFVFVNFLTDMIYGFVDPRVTRARLIG